MKIVIIFVVLIGFMMCAGESNHDQIKGWTTILNQHLDKYTEMQTTDIYKLIYQGICGPGHLGTDPRMIRKYLDQELSEIEANPDVSLMENISPDSEFIRINLKKFKSLKLPNDMLVHAIRKSSRSMQSDRNKLEEVWKSIKCEVETDRLKIDKKEFLKFYQFIEENNYPVVHHSELYMQRYSPAYRVVSKSVREEIIKQYIK